MVFAAIPLTQAQSVLSEDVDALSAVKLHKTHSHKYKGLLFIYKEFISSQDHSNCSFTPSCSVYMGQAIHQHGLFKGFLMGADRLARCNGGLSKEHYTFDPETKKLYDPVE